MNETDQILPALAKAQAAYPKIEKTKEGHYGKFANMLDIMEAVRKPNTDAGLIVLHILGIDGDTHYSESRVIHTESGQYIASRLRLDPLLSEQALGKAVTYAQKYCTKGLLGIQADEDTDAQEADDEQREREAAKTVKNAFVARAWQIFTAAPNGPTAREDRLSAITDVLGVHGVTTVNELDSAGRLAVLKTLEERFPAVS